MTDEEICAVADRVFLRPNGVIEFARAIIAAVDAERAKECEPVAWVDGDEIFWNEDPTLIDVIETAKPLYLHPRKESQP